MNSNLSYIPKNYVASNIPGELRMLDVLRDRLRDSQDIAISVSFLRYSGLGLIVDDLKNFVDRGGRLRILTSTYLGITQPEALQQLSKITGVECRVHVAGFANLLPTNRHHWFPYKAVHIQKWAPGMLGRLFKYDEGGACIKH